MTAVKKFLIVTLAFISLQGCQESTKPAPEEVVPALKIYLMTKKARTCSGTVTLDRLMITNIGEFDKENEGWPVYATFSVTCREVSKTTTWKSNDPSTNVITAYVRKSGSGEYECFIPERFRQAEEQMQKQMEESSKDMISK
jgi:hypothetical protein